MWGVLRRIRRFKPRRSGRSVNLPLILILWLALVTYYLATPSAFLPHLSAHLDLVHRKITLIVTLRSTPTVSISQSHYTSHHGPAIMRTSSWIKSLGGSATPHLPRPLQLASLRVSTANVPWQRSCNTHWWPCAHTIRTTYRGGTVQKI